MKLGLGLQLNKSKKVIDSPYGPDLLLYGDFSAGDLNDFDEVSSQYSVNGSNQLVQDHNATVQYLGVDFAFETGETYEISYDVISSDFDGTVSFSGTSMFGSTTLVDMGVGSHTTTRVAANGSSTMAFRLAIHSGTDGTQIVLDNIKIRKVL